MFLFFILFLLINSIRSCPLTDNYLSRCHCGILTNGESYIKCEEQTLDQIPTFKRSFPYDELILSNNHIKTLPRSSFDNIKTIKRINLENNSLSFIDHDLLRLLGNYLEELILTGDNHINSLEFLIRYPLKNLRILKLNQFNLSELNFTRLFVNMTKLEIVYLRSCQIKQIPNLSSIQILDLENNHISNPIYSSRSYTHLNLAQNLISSLNFSIFNDNLTHLNLNFNRLLSIHFNDHLPKKLITLSINNNLLKQIKFSHSYSSLLSSLDLSFNQLKTIENNSLFERLNNLNLHNNPLECNCHLTWLKTLVESKMHFNTSTWTCLSRKSFSASDFQCTTKLVIPRIILFNISYVKISLENGLFIRWSIIDKDNILHSIQISISEPFYLSPKFPANQTEIFLSNRIQSNRHYHICLILLHRYARDKYCREFVTDKLITLMSNEIILESVNRSAAHQSNYDINIYMMLIGSCIGGIITFLFVFLCCYLCFQIHKYRSKKKMKNEKNLCYYSRNVKIHYPIYHSHSTTCPYHHHENLSNSTDSSQIDASLSTTNLKHIYQTIDSQDYTSLKRENQLFDLWNESLRQKR